MSETKQLEENFNLAEEKLLKALQRLDGMIGGTVQNFGKLKKELAEKQGQEAPLLGNPEILKLQEENKKLRREKEEMEGKLSAELGKNEKLVRLKLEVSDKIENLIGQLEKAI